MIIVVASSHDRGAWALASRQHAVRVEVLTCEDLSVPGWRYYLPGAPAAAVVGGQRVAAGEITGVVTCLPAVSELELLHIVPADRAYVAAEMTAFLLSWLTTLSCPVINRPSPTCLCGPYWRPEQWAYAASRAGMRVQPVLRRVGLTAGFAPSVPAVTTVTVIGERCLGKAHPAVLNGARRLAQASGVELLTVRISNPAADATFLGAEPWPDLSSQETADAVITYVTEQSTNQRTAQRISGNARPRRCAVPVHHKDVQGDA